MSTKATPTPPAQAQAPASSTNPSPRKQKNAATARGNKSNLQSEDEVYLHLIEQYEKNSVALICCVNKYPHAKEGSIKLKDLDFSVADGEKLEAMLRAQGFQIEMLVDENVTKENIDRRLGNIMRKYPYKSPTIGRLYIMFSGHGLEDDATGASIFCCHDFTADDEYMTSYPLNELKEKLKHIGLKHQCVHLDCCHAGGIFSANKSRQVDFNVLQHAQDPVVQAITAVTRDEQALETGGNGIFTKHLCEEIENEGIFKSWGQDVVTLSQLFTVTKNKVMSEARESGGKMTPQHKDVLNRHLKEHCCGEMLFFRPGTTKEAWALKKSAPVAEKKASKTRGAAAAQAELSANMQAWAEAQKIQGVQALANALDELGLENADVGILTELDEEDMTTICGALKKYDRPKFKKGVAKEKEREKAKKLLSEKGIVDIHKQDEKGMAPLHRACRDNEIDVVNALLSTDGVDVNQADSNGRTPLSWASCKGHTEVVKLLLAKDADVNQADEDGETPLWRASFYGHTEVVKLLLANGADVNQADSDGQTPLALASFYGHTEIVALLKAAGAK